MHRRSLLRLAPAALVARAGAADPNSLRLVAYNIKRGFGMDKRTDLERTIAYLRKLEPDLLAVQEVDQKCGRSGRVDQTGEIAKALGMEGTFHKFMDFDGGEYGLSVFARPKIVDKNTHELPRGGEPRVAGELVVEVGKGKRLSFVGLHLDWTTTERRLPQAKALTKALAGREHPVILAGDFNAKPGSPTMKHFAEDYHVVAKEGDRLTFPSDKPKIEIDYFAVRGLADAPALRCSVLAEKVVSDHRPVVMDLPIDARR